MLSKANGQKLGNLEKTFEPASSERLLAQSLWYLLVSNGNVALWVETPSKSIWRISIGILFGKSYKSRTKAGIVFLLVLSVYPDPKDILNKLLIDGAKSLKAVT